MTTAPHSLISGRPLQTMRGPLYMGHFPYGLGIAIDKFDAIRAGLAADGKDYDEADAMAALPEFGPQLNRLARGLQRISAAGVFRIARKHSAICKLYMAQCGAVFRSLNGIFYWNDGRGETRRRVLLLAWRKGAAQ